MTGHPFRPLRRRAVRLVWAAGVISDIGTWVQLVVVGSLIAHDTGSALLTGLTALATFMPQGLAAPIGGLLADRYDRARVFIGGLIGQALFTGVLAALIAHGQRQPLVLIGAILCSSMCGSMGAPGYSAMLPDMVPPDELIAMVSLGIYSWNSGRIVGPLIGTLLNAAFGPAWTVAANAATFAALALAVGALRRPFRPPGTEATGVRERLTEGLTAARQVPGCRLAVAMIVTLNLCVGPFMGLLPIYSHSVFHRGVGLSGLFASVQGIGAIVGSLTFTAISASMGVSRPLRVVGLLLVFGYGLFALAPVPVVACVAVVCLGAGVSSLFVSGMGLLQRDAPTATRARVLSLAQAAMGFSYGIGILWIGALGDGVGLRWAFGAAATVTACLGWLLTQRFPNWRATIDGTTATIAAG